jgi:rhomboid protease GluP
MTFWWRTVTSTLEAVIALLEALGARGARWEWKKQTWRNALGQRIASWENLERGVRSRLRMCPACRALVERSLPACPACGASLRGVPGGGAGRLVALLLPGTGSVTMSLVTANVLMTLLVLGLWGSDPERGGLIGLLAAPWQALFVLGAKHAGAIAAGELWRLVTAGYLHGGLLHLVMNCSALVSLGPIIEEAFGARRFFIIYTVTGIAAFIASSLFSPRAFSVGASGSLFGLIGFGVVYGRLRGGAAGRALSDQLMRSVMFGVLLLLVPGIDHAAHFGGLIAGGLLGLLMSPRDAPNRAPESLLNLVAAATVLVTLWAFAAMVLSYGENLRLVAG